MSGKNLPPPGGADDLEALLRQRRVNTADDDQGERVAPVAPVAPRGTSRARAQGAGMDRRSWYMPKAVADALADAVEDLHYATRRPKHEVLKALVEVALEHRGEARDRLRGGDSH